jgi:hypothetical protein
MGEARDNGAAGGAGHEGLLGKTDTSRRSFIRLLTGTAFAAPLLVSFAMDGVAMAGPVCSGNSSTFACEVPRCGNQTSEDLTQQLCDIECGGAVRLVGYSKKGPCCNGIGGEGNKPFQIYVPCLEGSLQVRSPGPRQDHDDDVWLVTIERCTQGH